MLLKERFSFPKRYKHNKHDQIELGRCLVRGSHTHAVCQFYQPNPPRNVDYPDVIDLRRQLFPERDAYHLIGAPLSDLRWLDEVPLYFLPDF